MNQEIVTFEQNQIKTTKITRQRLPWHLRVISQIEKWYLNKVRGINPAAQRLIRVYTYNDEDGMNYDYSVPNYTYDLTCGMYDDFLVVADQVSSEIYDKFDIPGRYFYDVLLSVYYDQCDTNRFTVEQRFTYNYKIIKTDNPRCSLGNPKYRKDCSYIIDCDSHITIEGYKLSGKYTNFAQVLQDLATKTIIVHSKSDAKNLLKILKFLGIKHVYIGDRCKYNTPNKVNRFSRNVYGYQLFRQDNHIYVDILRKDLISTLPTDVMDIDEFIVGKSLRARLRGR